MSAELPVVSAPSNVSRHRGLATAAFLVAITLLGMRFTQFAGRGLGAIRYPFEMDYGEGIVWQQALRISSGAYEDRPLPAILLPLSTRFHLAALQSLECRSG